MAVVVLHKDRTVEEEIPRHEIECVIGGCNLGPVGQIWKSSRLPGTVMTAVRAMQLHIHAEHGLNGALKKKFLEDPRLIMSTVGSGG